MVAREKCKLTRFGTRYYALIPIAIIGMFLFAFVSMSGCGTPFTNSEHFSSNLQIVELTPLVNPSHVMPLGERLVYKITWLGIPVAFGEISVKEKINLAGREVYHVVGIVTTNKFLSTIYPVRNEAHSYMDARTLESVKFERNINEGSKKMHESETFDGTLKKGYYESLTTNVKKEFNVTIPVEDVLSVFYWVRRQTLVSAQSVKTVLTAEQNDWELVIEVLGRETLKLSQWGIVDTILVEPTTWTNGKERRGYAWFNVMNDSSRKPIRIVYKAPFGSVVGTLMKDSDI